MTTNQPVFDIKLLKINFKQTPTSQQGIMCNLLHNSRKLDNTEPFQVPANQKSVDLSSLKSLLFNVKQDDNKLPIFFYILYGDEPAKKIILKRSEMMKKYDLEQKDLFQFEQNFGVFSILYQVTIRKDGVSKEKNDIKQESSISNTVKLITKNQQTSARGFKRPSMLQIGEKSERIRKKSIDQKELSQIQVNMHADKSQQKQKKMNSKVQSISSVPTLTLVKDQKAQQHLVKKDLKINLFENFEKEGKKSVENQEKIEIKIGSHHGSNHNSKAHSVHSSHHSSHEGHKQSHKEHHKTGHGDHHNDHDSHQADHGKHNSHGHHDEHQSHSEPMSLKLKTVVAMLIIGFLFLMYDALDDRFSRKVRKVETIHDHGQDHTNQHDSHETQPKKKKAAKKTKKVSTH